MGAVTGELCGYRWWLGVAAIAVSALLAGCAPSSQPEVSTPISTPRPIVFSADGGPVWAHRSTIHVGDRTYDVSPHLVRELEWTPYRLYLQLSDDPVDGPYWNAEFDGARLTTIDDVYGSMVADPEGRYVAWIERNGPERPAGRVAQVVVHDASNGAVVFHSSDGMGGDEGDDLGDRYEELPPSVAGFEGDDLVWVNAEGSGSTVRTNLRTGESEVTDGGGLGQPTSGFTFWSPDGAFRVDAERTGRLRVQPRQPDFGHRWQVQGGWLDDRVMLVLAQDRFRFSYDPTVPDTTPGFLESCDLDAGTCRLLAKVTGAQDVVFPGVDVQY